MKYLDEAEYLKAIAHPYRLHILKLLTKGPKLSADIRKAIEASPGRTTVHLSRLYHSGFIGRNRVAQESEYYLIDQGIRKLLGVLEKL